MNHPSRNGTGGIQVITRAAALLRALDGQPQGLSLSQLSERISVQMPTQRFAGREAAIAGALAAARDQALTVLGATRSRRPAGRL
jgi:IclR helix-turn-helix domain